MSRVIVTADQFLTDERLNRPKRDVPVPELGNGAVVPVWGMTPSERTQWEEQFTNTKGKPNKVRRKQFRELLLVECCRADDGAPIFSASQVEALGNRSAVVVERLVNAAMDLSGISQHDVEEIAGNSDETPVS